MRFFLFFLFLGSLLFSDEDKDFAVVICSYNNRNWYTRNLESVFRQQYAKYRVIYVDDASNDETGDLVEEYVALRGLESKITLIKNSKRVTALANLYKAIQLCSPDEIVVILDGDDWFSNEGVLARLNKEYQDPNVWLTYGQHAYYYGDEYPLGPGISEKVPDHVLTNNNIRRNEEGGIVSHLRTFYAGLCHKIRKEDLLHQGKFYEMAYDVALMVPMMEMAGLHCRFIPDVLYIYNRATPINDDKINRHLQFTLDHIIRSKPKYRALESLSSVPSD